MSGLLEQNPIRNQQPKKNKKLGINKVAGLLICVIAVTGAKNGLDIYKEKRVAKEESSKINALMQQQKDEDAARIERVANNKVAYLTFDDGPNYNTDKILEILKQNNIKATFFLVGSMVENNPSIVRKIYDEGHTIGNHTYSHDYAYNTKEAFLSEVQKTDSLISKAIGKEYKSYFVRVPGGSMGKKVPQDAIKENGYKSINWTGVFGDDEKGGRVDSYHLMRRIDETVGDDKYEVILGHGTKGVTVDTLQKIIDEIKNKGYIFEKLMEDSPVEFS